MTKTMTKTDLTEIVNKRTNLNKRESAEIVEGVFALMKQSLESGENIKLAGFGNFEVKKKDSRRGRNPQTGETLQLPARKVLTFKPSKILKQTLNTQEI